MNFQAAFAYCKRGHDIRVPEWGGFWRWDAEAKTLNMHCRDGRILDFRDSEDLDYTLSFVFRNDWELVKNPGDTEHAQQAGPGRYQVGPTPCAVCGVFHAFWMPCPAVA